MNVISPVLAAAELAEPWQAILAAALATNAVVLAGYRIYRFTKGGPRADATGGAVLSALLVALAILVMNDVSWARWAALVYGLVFAVVVMPIWVLGVLIPLPPGPLDYSFTGIYEATLVVVVVGAFAA
jgi:hypothetical protein